MPDPARAGDLEAWIATLRARFSEAAPELLPLFETYAGEARFGRSYIAPDLLLLPTGARVLETGAGAFLLSCHLVKEGFDVTALEPTGAGFGHFDRMRQLVLNEARTQGHAPRVLDIPAEDLCETDRYDYAFSVNVMEHVRSPSRVLAVVGNSLRARSRYRFTCPNYLFPYEPHFNVPTLVSRRLTELVLGRWLRTTKRVPDPEGTWASLNWITVPQVRRAVRSLHGLRVVFGRYLLVSTLERVVTDRGFATRRSPLLCLVLGTIVRLGFHRIFATVPPVLQPLMDCSVEKA